MVNKINYILLNSIVLIILVSCTIGFADYFYEMRVTNCESILKTDYQVSTGEVSSCLRFQNYPIYNYWFPYYLMYFLFYIFLTIFQIMYYSMSESSEGHEERMFILMQEGERIRERARKLMEEE